MRLLDLIAQGRCASVQPNDSGTLPGAEQFKDAVRECPLRFVLSDELARCTTQLAYAEGDRLSACLDLIHMPARSLWVEWSDAPRLEALKDIPFFDLKCARSAHRAGALVCAAPSCRSGIIRTFWSSQDELAYLSPMVATFDLDDLMDESASGESRWRGITRLHLKEEPAIDELLGHLSFRFDDTWATYYEEQCSTQALRDQVLLANLECCAFDAPMLIAFALLLGARDLLPRQAIDHNKLNRARRGKGKPALLEHIEVHAPLDIPMSSDSRHSDPIFRSSPRLHHVRGHIVRRGDAVFWRSPHLRGRARLGQVRTRTVTMRFGSGAVMVH
jgi:hypothetical protein